MRALDHLDARAHDSRQLVDRDPGGERVRGERGAKVVEPGGISDAGRVD
jgi:hypothetical protein